MLKYKVFPKTYWNIQYKKRERERERERDMKNLKVGGKGSLRPKFVCHCFPAMSVLMRWLKYGTGLPQSFFL